jgi:hypothetical protein
MNFSEWLSTNEARWRGPVGGAFGNDSRRMQQQKRSVTPVSKPEEEMPKPDLGHAPNPADRTAPPQMRMGNRFQRIDQRVEYGKSIEKQIFDSLVQCGMKLREPSSQEDMYDKIDGWWETPSGEKPIQIKYRDTGDDILFEVMKDYRRGIPGRDMVGKAEFYAVLSRVGGKIVLVSVAEAKKLIEEMKTRAEDEGFDQRGNYRMGGAILRVRPDPRSQQDKLMAYIPVSMLKQIAPPCSAQVKF